MYMHLNASTPPTSDPQPDPGKFNPPTSPTGLATPSNILNFTYQSCYTEITVGRALSSFVLADSSITLQTCASNCTQYQYFGVEYGRECYCGNSLGSGSVPAADGRCNMACAGNSSMACGGPNGLTLYKNPNFEANPDAPSTPPSPVGPSIVSSIGNWQYVDCYIEIPGRALTGKAVASNDMLVAYCAGNCTGFNFFGVEYAKECYCGNSLSSGSMATTDGRCNMACAGNSSTICGGPNGLSYYRFVVPSSSSSTTSSKTLMSSSTVFAGSPSVAMSTTQSAFSTIIVASASSTRSSTSVTTFSTLFDSTTSSSSTSSSTSFLQVLSTSMTSVTITTLSRSTISTGTSSTSMSVLGSLATFSITTSTVSTAMSTTTSTFTRSSAASTSPGSTTSSSSTMEIPTSMTMTTTIPFQRSAALTATVGSASSTSSTSRGSSSSSIMSTTASSSSSTTYHSPSPPATSTGTSMSSKSIITSSTTIIPPSSFSLVLSSSSSRSATAISSIIPSSSSLGSSLTSRTTSTWTSSPSPTSEPDPTDPYIPLGCAPEASGGRLLSSLSSTSNSMTVQTCQSFCTSNGFPFSGVEYGRECYCSSRLAASTAVNATGCSMPCAGNGTQTCGGRSQLNVYRNALLPVAGTQTPLLGYGYSGCYTDSSAAARLLGRYSFSSVSGMTQGVCVAACQDRGFGYAGVEYGRECYCGDGMNLVGPGGKAEKAASEDECDMLCTGDRAQICGGRSRIGVWSVQG
ncbi:uncharacterized protein A1O9_04379 [Exophiala aquamarina CBS 119918]|uniref:WSC domain-containing protein n=1 Tax=Exophiala aquamarina CBS 119918 TaxID=1182545 RepID=A0A072PVC9_9EURO|nr:uncharacterized protein A1O9_04379 [Exophiala aquamarina CBS 119918]KEF59535.1 hypothetical protein A1O9_04379 [Exophiala aquamarina CBS 119918]